MPQITKIDVIKAAHLAMIYFRRIYRSGFMRIKIEEVEMTEDERYWLITVGYDIPGTSGVTITEAIGGKKRMPLREYKELKIDAITGEVKYMKIIKI